MESSTLEGAQGEARPARRGLALASILAVLVGATGCNDSAPEPLLLLVTVDTLRADRLGAYGSDRHLTPNLDELARESLRFGSAYSAAAVTLPSIASILTGLYPESIGVRSNSSALQEDVATLATRLRARGWRTGAVVSNLVLRAESGLANGFDRYDDELMQREAVRDWPERTAPHTTDAALRLFDVLSASAAPGIFLWVHYQDPHGPYTPPSALRLKQLPREQADEDGTRELPVQPGHARLGALPNYQFIDERRDVAFYRAGYSAEVNFFDREFGRLRDELRARGWWDRAVVAFTADHGESLGENNFWFAHGEYLSESLVRVPLLLRAPGHVPGTRDDPVSLVDLLPTLLNSVLGSLADAELPGGMPGRDLLAKDAQAAPSVPYFATLGGSRVRRIGLVLGDYKLVATFSAGGWRDQLYRRSRTIPAAAVPLDADPLKRELRGELSRIRRQYAQARVEQKQILTEEDLKNLRALGYVEED